MERSSVVVFRTSLLLYVLILLGMYVKVFVIGVGVLPEPALAYLRWWHQEPQSIVERAAGWIGMVTSIVSLASAIAMVFFAPWTRHVFVACTVILLGAEAMGDFPFLKSPTENFFDTALAILAGGIVVFSYWSRVADGFSKRAP